MILRHWVTGDALPPHLAVETQLLEMALNVWRYDRGGSIRSYVWAVTLIQQILMLLHEPGHVSQATTQDPHAGTVEHDPADLEEILADGNVTVVRTHKVVTGCQMLASLLDEDGFDQLRQEAWAYRERHPHEATSEPLPSPRATGQRLAAGSPTAGRSLAGGRQQRRQVMDTLPAGPLASSRC